MQDLHAYILQTARNAICSRGLVSFPDSQYGARLHWESGNEISRGPLANKGDIYGMLCLHTCLQNKQTDLFDEGNELSLHKIIILGVSPVEKFLKPFKRPKVFFWSKSVWMNLDVTVSQMHRSATMHIKVFYGHTEVAVMIKQHIWAGSCNQYQSSHIKLPSFDKKQIREVFLDYELFMLVRTSSKSIMEGRQIGENGYSITTIPLWSFEHPPRGRAWVCILEEVDTIRRVVEQKRSWHYLHLIHVAIVQMELFPECFKLPFLCPSYLVSISNGRNQRISRVCQPLNDWMP